MLKRYSFQYAEKENTTEQIGVKDDTVVCKSRVSLYMCRKVDKNIVIFIVI